MRKKSTKPEKNGNCPFDKINTPEGIQRIVEVFCQSRNISDHSKVRNETEMFLGLLKAIDIVLTENENEI